MIALSDDALTEFAQKMAQPDIRIHDICGVFMEGTKEYPKAFYLYGNVRSVHNNLHVKCLHGENKLFHLRTKEKKMQATANDTTLVLYDSNMQTLEIFSYNFEEHGPIFCLHENGMISHMFGMVDSRFR